MESEDKIPTNLTEQVPDWKLRLAYLYTQHKIAIKRGGWFLLFFINLIIIMALGVLFVNYQVGRLNEAKLLSQLPQNLVDKASIEKNKPHNLLIEPVKIIKAADDNYVNLLAKISNPNKQWAINSLKYGFMLDGQLAEAGTTFILPASEKYIILFNMPRPQKAELKILTQQWQRIKDYSLLSYKDGIKVLNSNFTPSDSKIFSGNSSIELYNDTPFGFWEVGLTVILYNKQLEPISADYIVINKLKPREKRKIKINWQEKIKQRVYQVGVYPEVNLLNEQSLMQLEAPPGQPPGLE